MPKLKIFILSVLIPIFGMAQNVTSEDFQFLKSNTIYNPEWISLGPVVNSARAEAVQAHPDQPGVLYVAFGSGGLWKSINNGLSWTPIFEEKTSLGIGDFAIAPSNPSIIYLGTGESLRKARNFTMPGDGVYRSEDSGENWTNIGLPNTRHIGEIAIHPSNPDIALVAALGNFWSKSNSRGIYKTEDGGKTWYHTLYIDETTGANDVVISPSDPSKVYASMWEFKAGVKGDIKENNMGENSGLYHSEDGGSSWSKSESNLPYGPKMGRMSVTVSYSNPDKAYILVDNHENPNMESAEVYKTLDGGLTWTKTLQNPLKIFSVIGWYFTDIYVDPKDDDKIYCLGVRLATSEDGGKTFSYLGGNVQHLNLSAAKGMHLDHCEMWINPRNSQHLLLANDGGIYSSYDEGGSWLHYNNIPAGEFYDITIDNNDPYRIFGGVQDDATVFGPAKEYTSLNSDPWKYLWIDPWNGGDGCVTQVDPKDPNTVYFSMQNGAIRRVDMTTNVVTAIKPKLPHEEQGELKYNFITPYLISPHHSQTLYHGGNFVFKSTNRGDDWEAISNDLSSSENKSKNSVSAGALAESPLQQGLLYMGTDNGLFWTTKNDGKDWTDYSKGLPNAYMRSIAPSNFKNGRVYVALTGINYDDMDSHLFVSENFGANWKSISTNLPDEPVNVIAEDPIHQNILYAGGYKGLYVTINQGKSWNYFGNGMPLISISDIEFHRNSGDLIVSTHGRGIYLFNLLPFYEMQDLDSDKNHLLSIPIGTSPESIHSGIIPNYSSVEKLVFSFWLNKEMNIKCSIYDSEDQVIFQTELNRKKGFNQFRWDLILEKTESDMPYFIHYDKFIEAGNYKVILEVGNKQLSRELTIINNKSPKTR